MDLPLVSFHDYTVVSRKGAHAVLIVKDGILTYLKLFDLEEDENLYHQEVKAYTRLEGLDVAPHLIGFGIEDGIGYLHIQAYASTLLEIMHLLTSEQKQTIADQVRQQVNRMHEANLGHGDLHLGNIVVLPEGNGRWKTAIVDFERSYNIDTGETDPRAMQWRAEGFEWQDSYEAFVKYDYENWYDEMKTV